jgi:hypothetical protein
MASIRRFLRSSDKPAAPEVPSTPPIASLTTENVTELDNTSRASTIDLMELPEVDGDPQIQHLLKAKDDAEYACGQY